MHELSIAVEILEPVLACAAEHGAARVTALTVRAGALQHIVPESLQLAFHGAAEGTCAQGAVLTIEHVAVTARCRRCEQEFEVEDFLFACPDCGVADVETITGDELLLTAVELADPEPAV